MREIKFRAWDKTQKCMVTQILGWARNIIDIGSELNRITLNQSDFILMQYTGLHDKNGKEIYEGDIVPVDGKNYEVRFNSVYCRYSLWSEKYAAGVYRHLLCAGLPKPLEFPTEGDINTKDIEVIGNIYENPELLKEANK